MKARPPLMARLAPRTLALTLLALPSALVACKKEVPPVAESAPAAPQQTNSAAPVAPAQPAAAQPAAPANAAGDAGGTAPTAAATNPALLQPANLLEKAPAKFKAKFTTSEGDFVVEVTRDWSPNGADRFYNLVKQGFFDNVRFFRAVKGFMVQFGVHGDPAVNKAWRDANIGDDPVKQSNKRGMVTFAQTSMPNSRSTQIFINLADNQRLDGMRFAPFGRIVSGMEVVDKLYTGYGEGAPMGRGPDQIRLGDEGNAYLMKEFPELDFVKQAKITR